MPAAQILTIGDELLSGDTVNSNLAFLGERCRQLGISVLRAVSVRDRVDEIVAALTDAAGWADLCLVSGGLGPTSDDLTAEAVARACGVPLERNAEAEAAIAAMYVKFNRPMPEINKKQADLPAGADMLVNPIGTAPGFAVRLPASAESGGRCYVACMPGVPREMKRMMLEQIEPRLVREQALTPTHRRIYRAIGRGESAIAVDIEPIVAEARGRSAGLANLYLHYRAAAPQVLIIAEGTPGPDGARATTAELAGLDAAFEQALQPALYGLGEADLPERVVAALRRAGKTVATAESCTGGRVGALLTGVAGASACFHGGVIAYDNRIKREILGVSEADLLTHGAVSEPVARAMAGGARRALGTDFAVGVTGVAGPDGGSPEKPVGTVDIAVADAHGCTYKRLTLHGERPLIQHVSALWALKLVWDRLVELGLARVEAMD
jgi:nicotinamide-nucleotide amidase